MFENYVKCCDLLNGSVFEISGLARMKTIPTNLTTFIQINLLQSDANKIALLSN